MVLDIHYLLGNNFGNSRKEQMTPRKPAKPGPKKRPRNKWKEIYKQPGVMTVKKYENGDMEWIFHGMENFKMPEKEE